MIRHLTSYIGLSIVKKQVMGVTGLLLCGFLVTHLLGNLLLFAPTPDYFNLYAYKLTSNPAIYLAEVILGSIFLVHIGMAIRLIIENKKARPVKYYMKQNTGRGSNIFSMTMPYTGALTAIFLGLHIYQFKFGTEYFTMIDGVQVRDLAKLVYEFYQSPLNVAWYVVCMLSLAFHVRHGFWSAFQSLGFNHPKYNSILTKVSWAYCALVGLGFSSIPVFCFLMKGGN